MLGRWSLPLFTTVTITYLLVNSRANCPLLIAGCLQWSPLYKLLGNTNYGVHIFYLLFFTQCTAYVQLLMTCLILRLITETHIILACVYLLVCTMYCAILGSSTTAYCSYLHEWTGSSRWGIEKVVWYVFFVTDETCIWHQLLKALNYILMPVIGFVAWFMEEAQLLTCVTLCGRGLRTVCWYKCCYD